MTSISIWSPGDIVARYDTPPVTRGELALYAGASGDHNPLHIDSDAARESGLDDVIGHGMLAMAKLAQAVTRAAPQQRLRSFGTRFMAPVLVGETLCCTAIVSAIETNDGERRARLSLEGVNQAGAVKLAGTAIICIEEDR